MNEIEIKNKIIDIIKIVEPYDEIERKHKKDILNWIASGIEIFRIEKPANPLKHLVCYSVLIDPEEKKILLFDHRKALLMLPSGGHANKDEMPLGTAERELAEELKINPDLLFTENDAPFFITVMETVGVTAGHVDVDLWYVFKGNSKLPVNDTGGEFVREFAGYRWLGFDEILAAPLNKFDINMHRFVRKLQRRLD